MRFLIACFLLLTPSVVFAANEVTVVVLYNGVGVPDGWIDSSTRPEVTEICRAMIANQSKEYSTPSSRSRCIIQVRK
jgi:hypothetical protein